MSKVAISSLVAMTLLLLAAGLGWAGALEDFKIAFAAVDRGDYATALRLFRTLAAQGFPGAKWALGTMYSEGKGVPKDDLAALTWHRQAADQGYLLSQYEIGARYDRGIGVGKDHAEAAKWFRRSAEQGYGMAQVNLGAMYSGGEGVSQDYIEAYKWFSVAAAGGGYLENERVKLDAIKRRDACRDGDFVFPGQKPGKPLSVMALEMMLRRMKIEGVTVHSFRSAFRDWAAESTNFTNEVCEAALAHVIENKAEAAYRRGDLFDKRRKLMEAWAVYCAAPKAGKVVAFRR